uniref:Ovule protein n=1 Tax=Romanomermis culicivorax TaxID=13658 RepID=A0A915IKE7_ROMCU
ESRDCFEIPSQKKQELFYCPLPHWKFTISTKIRFIFVWRTTLTMEHKIEPAENSASNILSANTFIFKG